MMKHFWLLTMVVVLVGLLLMHTVAYSVSFNEIVVISRFGKAGEPIIGAEGKKSGLQFKLPYPIESSDSYDARVHVFEDAHGQLSTSKATVLVTVFCGWRIRSADAAIFHEKVGDIKKAEDLLRSAVRNQKAIVVGRTPLSAMLNTDRSQMRIAEIEQEIQRLVQKDVGDEFGIEIVTLGINAFALPDTVTKEVIKVMKSERVKAAGVYLAQGRADAVVISARAQASRMQIMAFANARAEAIRTEGRALAAGMFGTYEKNQALAIFLKELEFLRKSMDQATLILDGSTQRSLDFFHKGATLPTKKTLPTPPKK